MKRLIKKLAIVLLSSLLAMTPVYAIETATTTTNKPNEEKVVLSLAKAIDAAYTYSLELSNNAAALEQYKAQMDSLSVKGLVNQYQATYYSKLKNEQDKDFIKDKITYDITNQYYGMVTQKKAIRLLDEKIALQQKYMRRADIQKENGLLDNLAYQKVKADLEATKVEKDKAVQTFEQLQKNFEINTNIKPDSYMLEETIEYTPLEFKGSIEGYATSMAGKLTEYSQKIAEYSNEARIDALLNGPMVFKSDLEDAKAGSVQNVNNIEQAKKSYKQAIIATYTTLLNTEKSIAVAKEQLLIKEGELAKLDIQFKAKLVSQLDYDEAVYTKNELEQKIYDSIVLYNKCKMSFEKPWVGQVSALGQ